MIIFLHIFALFEVKNAIFANFFGEDIFKNHNIGPWTLKCSVVFDEIKSETMTKRTRSTIWANFVHNGNH
jgi:hypothetical protein